MATPSDNRILDAVSVLAFAIITAFLVQDLFRIDLAWLGVVCAIVLGYVLADGVSGFVHFLGDSFGSEKTPIIGKTFIAPFRIHHTDPVDITRHDFLATNGNNCLGSLPLMLFMHLFLAPRMTGSVLLSFIFLASFSLVMSIFATNQIHKWAHMKKPPFGVSLLQRSRLILSPKHHAVHHIAPHNKYFCITTGWLNPIIEKLKK